MEEGQSALLGTFALDVRFRNFLRARKARILLPVNKDQGRSFLLFLNTGGIWPCEERFTPRLESDMEIVLKIKREAQKPAYGGAANRSWSIKVPTSMSMLAEGHQLPRFGES